MNFIKAIGASLIAAVFYFQIPAQAIDQSATQVEAQFITDMSEHHKHGIEMAKMAQEKAQSTKVKQLSQKIIKDQTKDIAKLETWQKRWHAGHEMKADVPEMDMSKLEASEGKEFDKAFLDMMSKHHEDGVKMARQVVPKLEHKEVREFAQKSIEKQTAEIEKIDKIESSIR